MRSLPDLSVSTGRPRSSITVDEGQPRVDLGAHDLTVRGRVVVPAQQRAFEVRMGTFETLDLVVESLEPLPGDGFHSATSVATRTPAMSSRAKPASCSMPMKTNRRAASMNISPPR